MASPKDLRLDNGRALALLIESTLLDPRASLRSFEVLLDEARRYGFRCVLVPSSTVPQLSDLSSGLGVGLCSVVGFPSGLFSRRVKLAELDEVLSHEVMSLDLVPNFTLLEREEELEAEICDVGEGVRGRAELKVIVEAPLLKEEELELLAKVSARCGASYLKTSTGVYSKGGDAESVRRTIAIAERYGLKVKAAGGIRTLSDLVGALRAGASLVGTSSAGKIWEEYLNLKSRGEER